MSDTGNPENGRNFLRLNRSFGDPESPKIIDVEPVTVEDEPHPARTLPPNHTAPPPNHTAPPPNHTTPPPPPRAHPPRPDAPEPNRPPVDYGSYPEPVAPHRIRLDDGDLRIGVWGAPRAGKTTFLRAMPFAALRPVRGRRWTISGVDDPSRRFLADGIRIVIDDPKYPAASRGSNLLAWKFRGREYREPTGPAPSWRERLHTWLHHSATQFTVEVQDASGEGFDKAKQPVLFDRIVEHLASAQGIVFLFDPVSAGSLETNALQHYYDTAQALKTKLDERGLLTDGGQLPHHVSVCVTKLDKREVFRAALEAEVIQQETDESIPVVDEDFAPELMKRLCVDSSSRFVYEQLINDFLPSRVKYFITSAAGFHLPGGRFDRSDFTNEENGCVRSAAAPINVLEPIISLQERIAKTPVGEE